MPPVAVFFRTKPYSRDFESILMSILRLPAIIHAMLVAHNRVTVKRHQRQTRS
ncbi:MAG: uncharacterized membrane protein YqaE (UPF0057 family) [Pseudohongiellaceae bacterium]|jgi:uncharacterized membrane protein YqaE (UPF0057 family)